MSASNLKQAQKDNITTLKANYGVLEKAKVKPVAGTKYNHVGARQGLASVMDRDIINHNLSQREKNYGGGGYTFKMVKKDGTDDVGATMNIGGRLHVARADGTFRVVDEDYLELVEREEKERKEYVKSIVRKCIISDEVCAHVLGISIGELQGLCAAGGCLKQALGDALSISKDIDDYNCLPSYLECLDESSTFFTGGVQKLTKIVNGFLPIVEHATPASVEHKGEE